MFMNTSIKGQSSEKFVMYIIFVVQAMSSDKEASRDMVDGRERDPLKGMNKENKAIFSTLSGFVFPVVLPLGVGFLHFCLKI